MTIRFNALAAVAAAAFVSTAAVAAPQFSQVDFAAAAAANASTESGPVTIDGMTFSSTDGYVFGPNAGLYTELGPVVLSDLSGGSAPLTVTFDTAQDVGQLRLRAGRLPGLRRRRHADGHGQQQQLDDRHRPGAWHRLVSGRLCHLHRRDPVHVADVQQRLRHYRGPGPGTRFDGHAGRGPRGRLPPCAAVAPRNFLRRHDADGPALVAGPLCVLLSAGLAAERLARFCRWISRVPVRSCQVIHTSTAYSVSGGPVRLRRRGQGRGDLHSPMVAPAIVSLPFAWCQCCAGRRLGQPRLGAHRRILIACPKPAKPPRPFPWPRSSR